MRVWDNCKLVMVVPYKFFSDKAISSKNNFKASPPYRTQATEGLLLVLQFEEFGRWITSLQSLKYLFLSHLLALNAFFFSFLNVEILFSVSQHHCPFLAYFPSLLMIWALGICSPSGCSSAASPCCLAVLAVLLKGQEHKLQKVLPPFSISVF